MYVDPLGLAIGDLPPSPPGYNSKWPTGKYPNGTWWTKPGDDTTWTTHPEDEQHWRHWDIWRNGKKTGTWPKQSGKPRNDNGKMQKRLKPNQCKDDPSGEEPAWEPPQSPDAVPNPEGITGKTPEEIRLEMELDIQMKTEIPIE